RSHVRTHRQRSQDLKSSGFSHIEKGLYALIDERYKSELETLRKTIKKQAADHQTQLTALRADFANGSQKVEAFDGTQIIKMETQIKIEKARIRRLEDENKRLQNKIARLEGGLEAGMNDLQDHIKQL
ncbi:hypothetical protein M436DRAFT_33557, partial [Aureobasidium namibiae CBS 147.97]